ncbi:MAG: STAS domain-containing protein [Firmicutes bacterium]|nr:STAS domain-containing protein [Bacillota bacterium]
MELEFLGQFGKVIPPQRVDLANAHEFRQALQSLFEQGCSTIIIDCTDLAIIDSAALGTMVMFQKRLKERGGELKMINVRHSHIKNLFDMIELDRIIQIERT